MGDALGAPSEAMSRTEIMEKFGGRIETFVDGSDNQYALGNRVAEITDDTTQMYEMAKAMIKCGGELTVQDAADALIAWSKGYPRFYPASAGPTTRLVIEELTAGKDPFRVGTAFGTYTYARGTTNGAAMRIAAAGLVDPGNWQKAMEKAIIMTTPSHATQHAYAGAAAIACGIAEALRPVSNPLAMVKACVWGAKQAEKRGLETVRRAPGPSVAPMILRAVEAALDSDSMPEAEEKIERQVGNDVSIQSSVAVAVGLFVAAEGDPVKTIIGGANIGGDTDTLACIAGMLSGAYSGFSALPKDWWEQFKEVNSTMDFEAVGKQLAAIAQKNISRGGER
jgi:ADP-ribosylglycohydrolase